MNASPNITPDAHLPLPAHGMETLRRLGRAMALAAAALIAALAFGGYSQPELLLNFVGLGYCG